LGIAADFVLIVLAGLAGGVLARLLRLPLLAGYVVAGVVVGPHTAGPTVTQIKDIETLAEIGVALLLFSIGLEVSFRDLRPVRAVAVGGGAIQLVVTITAGALAAQWALAAGQAESIWFGAMISVSSTMVVLKMIAAGGYLSTLASRVMIGILVVQDLAVIPLLIVLPQLMTPDGLAGRLAQSMGLAAALVAATYGVGNYLLPPLLRRILGWGSRELFLVAIVAVGVGVGAAMHAAGFSFALGAFVAGLVLSESEFSHQALSDVVPLRDIFGLLFFVSVGMLFDPAYAIANWQLIFVAVLAVVAGKAVILGAIVRGFGYRNMAPWIAGLGLSQVGEFSFVLARAGLQSGQVSKPVYDLVLTITVLSMAAAPLISGLAVPLGRRFQRRETGDPAVVEARGHVVVGGFGRAGRAVARALREAGAEFIVVESNYVLVAGIKAEGYTALWGDLSQPEILHAAGIDKAKLLLLTMPDPNAVNLAVERARAKNPNVVVVARSAKASHLGTLRELGVTAAVQPEFEGGLEMVRQGLTWCGYGGEAAASITDGIRRELYANEFEERPSGLFVLKPDHLAPDDKA